MPALEIQHLRTFTMPTNPRPLRELLRVAGWYDWTDLPYVGRPNLGARGINPLSLRGQF